MADLTFDWIGCPLLPRHPCKNGTHSTSFSNTREHTANLVRVFLCFLSLCFSRKGFCRNPRGIFPNKVPGEFGGEFFGGFFGAFFLGRKGGTRPSKNPQLAALHKRGGSLRCANTQPFLCNELGPAQGISGSFSGNSRKSVWAVFRQFQTISGNFRQCYRRLWGPKPKRKPVLINKG